MSRHCDDLTGQKFTRLLVLERVEDRVTKSGARRIQYKCLCDCGNYKIVDGRHLKDGSTMSCGCLANEVHRQSKGTGPRCWWHDLLRTRIYRVWGNMVNRCKNPNNPAYHNYGGRGIDVCDEWTRFENFYLWSVYNGYEEGLELDRINNDGWYTPDNCRWTDRITQANNRRSNVIVEYQGEKMTVAELARTINMPYKILHDRLRNGWTIERAMTQPIRKPPTKRT